MQISPTAHLRPRPSYRLSRSCQHHVQLRHSPRFLQCVIHSQSIYPEPIPHPGYDLYTLHHLLTCKSILYFGSALNNQVMIVHYSRQLRWFRLIRREAGISQRTSRTHYSKAEFPTNAASSSKVSRTPNGIITKDRPGWALLQP